MAKKSKYAADSAGRMVPNLSLSRTAKVGEKTEDELLLQRKKAAQPTPRAPEQAEFKRGDPWRVLRIMGEFVHSFDSLAEVGAAITFFGSARTEESDPMYHAARDLAGRLSKNRVIATIAFGYVYFFRGTPLLAQHFLIYYGAGQFVGPLKAIGVWGFFRDAFNCALFAFAINTAI